MTTYEREQERARQWNMNDRRTAIVCMEFLARQINDEDILDGWLMCGVADGDIEYGNLDITQDCVDGYIGDSEFKGIMSCFLRRMSKANKSGGLYCGGIVSDVVDNTSRV